MSVEKIDPDLKKAEGEVNKVVRAYLAEAKALGARDEQVSTTGVSINPEYVCPRAGANGASPATASAGRFRCGWRTSTSSASSSCAPPPPV